ncbi:hypothetical protein Trydic_g3306 [Trypoxylus dichotomus]
MDVTEILGTKDQAIQDTMRKQLGIGPLELEKLIVSFKKWLRHETYLPKITDPHFIATYVIHCKCNLEEAKRKFEDWLVARYRLKSLIVQSLDYEYFDSTVLERTLICSPKLTPEGYRLGFGTVPEDVNNFDFQKIFNYGVALLEFFAFNDECAGYITIYDLKYLTAQHLGKINVKLLVEGINLLYNTYPTKIVQNHFINVPPISEILISIAKRIVGEDVMKTVIIHKTITDLAQSLPKDCLPVEYGGVSNIKLHEIAEKQKRFIVENTEFRRQRQGLKFLGDLPQDKRQQYSFDLTGDIRQLDID